MTPDEKREKQRIRNALPENVERRRSYAQTARGHEVLRQASRRYYAKHHERLQEERNQPEARMSASERSRRHYAANKDTILPKMRVYQLMDRFHLTPEQYDAMLSAQGGVCVVCGEPPPTEGRLKNLAVDHDHNCCPGSKSCGRCVRGLLCSNCNVAIGLLGDDVARVEALLAYLKGNA